MNASHSRYLWTSVTASGALHAAAVAGLLASGGTASGWALRAYTPPPGHSAPQLTLRMPAAASHLDASPEHILRVEFATTSASQNNRESLEARSVPAARESSDAPELVASSPAHVEYFRTVAGEELVVAARGAIPAATRPEQTPHEPWSADQTTSATSPRRTTINARIATQTGARADAHVERADNPRSPRRDPDGKSAANSSASHASERRTGVAAAIPEKVFSPHPDYPADELAAGHEGRVILRVTVNARGSVESAVVQRSSGFPALDAAAQEAVRRWRFRLPNAAANDPRATREVAVPIRFEIQR